MISSAVEHLVYTERVGSSKLSSPTIPPDNYTMLENNNITKYGIYRVGSQSFYNKMEALVEHIKTNVPITWHLFEDELATFNLLEEPSEDIETLYAQRAIQLRQDYDHIVLQWSGGNDCAKIAEVFIANGLIIDELYIRAPKYEYRMEQFNAGIDPEGDEVEHLSVPTAKFLKENFWPNLKISVIDDFSEKTIDYVINNPDWYEKRQSTSIDPMSLLRGDLDVMNPEWRKMTELGKRIAHVAGKEKPQIRRDDVGFYFRYSDISHLDYIAPRATERELPQYVELFYWDPTTVKMQIKQAHMIRRAWNPIIETINTNAGTRMLEDELAKVLYGPRMIPQPHSPLKPNDVINGIKDNQPAKSNSQWFVRDINSDHAKIWARGVFELYNRVKPLYSNKIDFYRKGFPSITTKNHYIWYH